MMKTLLDAGLLHGDCLTVTGRTLAENLADVQPTRKPTDYPPLSDPIKKDSHLVILYGNLARRAPSPKSRQGGPCFEGRARVYDSEEQR